MSDTDRLLEFYREYLGDPDRTTDVYVGFALFFAGVGLGATGVILFLLSARLGDTMTALTIREVAAVAAAIGLPALLSSVVVLLPVDRRMLYVAGVGSAICLVAVGIFVWAYPYNWNVTTARDYSAIGIGVYSLGVVCVIAATGSALVAHQIEQTGSAVAGGGSGSGAGASAAAGTGATTTADSTMDAEAAEQQALADVERELDNAELTWGGVQKDEGRSLTLDTGDVDDVDGGNVDASSATTTRSTGTNVDAAVDGLKSLQGGETETASGGGTDDQANALRELREQKRAEEEADGEGDGVIDRVKGFL